MTKHKQIAKLDPVHCLAPGLFSSVQKGKRPKLDIKYQLDDDIYWFWGPDQLGDDDLLVLQGLTSLAGRAETGLIDLEPNPVTQVGQIAREKLKATGEAAKQKAIVVKCSYRTFFDEVDLVGGGKQIKALKTCLMRLFAVSIIYLKRKDTGHRLLSEYESDDAGLYVTLNPMIATAINNSDYIGINMHEVRAIKSGATRIIHQRLCGYMRPGESRYITLDTLVAYAYPVASAIVTTTKKRRSAIRAALRELAGLGWPIIETFDKFKIGRP
jgi:hypothetical protein